MPEERAGDASNGRDAADASDGTDAADASNGTDAADASEDDDPATPPRDVIDEAVRLTRLARGAVDESEAAAYREERDELLAEYGYTTRIREGDASDDAVLVCHPAEWLEDGVVEVDSVEDVDRGIERSLEGVGDGDWETVAQRNDALVERIEENHGDPHAATARALADFASNHYAKPIAELTPAEREEFAEEYFPRNAWPSDEQAARLDDSLDLIVEECDGDIGDQR